MLKVVSLFLVVIAQAISQNPSPCPEIFSYEPRGQEEDRWYGVISLQSHEDLDGVWLKIILDRPAELLGNWFGEATSSDNQEFTVKNPRYKLEAGPPVSVRFFVKYNLASTIPSVQTIRLNGKTICTSRHEEVVSTTPQLHISQIRPSRPNNRPVVGSQGTFLNSNSNEATSQERPNLSHQTRPSGSGSQQRPSSTGSQQQRPSSTGSQQQRPTSSGSQQQRPSSVGNQQQQQRPSGNSHVNSVQERPSGGSSQERPSNNYNNHQSSSHNSQSSSNNRRPSSSSHQTTTTTTDRYHRREPSSHSSGSNSNGLSAEDTSASSDSDFFPGDFALHTPNQVRPPSRPSSPSKRNVQCGTVAMRASPLISYGQNTSQGQWPWHAALYHSQGAQLMYTCGATLISEHHVLTAAHCVAKPQSNRPVATKNLIVYLGKYNLKKFGSGTQDREVSDIFINPQYNYSVYFNDIAVLKLKNPIDITNYVRPCCLWEDSVDIEPVLNKLGTVVGWGFDENRQISETLMQAQMPVVSTVNCIYSNREFFSQFTFEKTYCAGFRNGTTVCNGDSGGGMVFPKSGTSGHSTVWQIRGIVSVGVALQGQGVCDPRHYIVFTDVAKHLDWIKQVMNE